MMMAEIRDLLVARILKQIGDSQVLDFWMTLSVREENKMSVDNLPQEMHEARTSAQASYKQTTFN